AIGCRQIFLVGHSAGCFYAAGYSAFDPDIQGLVLLSPLTSNKTNLRMWFPKDSDQEAATSRAQEMVAAGYGHHIIPLTAWYYGVSAETLIQRVNEPDGIWSRNLNTHRHPILVMWGGMESRGPIFRSLVEQLHTTDKDWHEIPD